MTVPANVGVPSPRRNRHGAAPERSFQPGVLTIGGFLAGIMFWGGFNTALEPTNTETICISCHEMRNNVYEELRQTIHFTNRSAPSWRSMNGRGSRQMTRSSAATATASTTWASPGRASARPRRTYLASGEKTCIECHKGIATSCLI